MATDKILVDRQTDGEKCCGECLWFANEPEEYCCLFGQPLGDDLQRCPACLATPSARELTPEMVQAVEGTLKLLEWLVDERIAHIESNGLVRIEESWAKLRAAFGIEEGSGDSWRCGICGAVRSGVEPVQDAECGDSCPEHFKEEV